MNRFRYCVWKHLGENSGTDNPNQVTYGTKRLAMYICAWNAVPYPGWEEKKNTLISKNKEHFDNKKVHFDIEKRTL